MSKLLQFLKTTLLGGELLAALPAKHSCDHPWINPTAHEFLARQNLDAHAVRRGNAT